MRVQLFQVLTKALRQAQGKSGESDDEGVEEGEEEEEEEEEDHPAAVSSNSSSIPWGPPGEEDSLTRTPVNLGKGPYCIVSLL